MLSPNVVQDLKVQCATMKVGQGLRQDTCPTCHGGTFGERSFSVSVTERGIEFCCHRASCKERGVIPTNGVKGIYEDMITHVETKSELRPFKHETVSLEDHDFKSFEARYGILAQELLDNNVVKCPSRRSFIFPAYNIVGEAIGKVERWYPKWYNIGHKGPKSMYYKEVDHPKMYVPRTAGICDTVFIVEDTLSAIKVARTHMSLALLGASMNISIVKKLTDFQIKHVAFLLDPDAASKALELKKEFGLFFYKVNAVLLTKDPKDMKDEELRERLYATAS